MRPSRPGEPLGIVAGGGELPRIVAAAAAAKGWRPSVVVIADAIGSDWSQYDSREFTWGRVGDAIAHMRGREVRRMVFCGTVSVRPDFRSVFPSLATLRVLPEALRVVRGGDDSLLRAAAKAFERRGFEMLAVQELVPELLIPAGALTSRVPDAGERAALAHGARAASLIGQLDVGQAIVASKDRIIAMEAIEGTREMLERVSGLKARGKIGPRERCVLVKLVKPGQDERFDLPSIGPATVREAATAGLSGIGLSAGCGLVIGLDDVLHEARRHSIFLTGIGGSGEAES